MTAIARQATSRDLDRVTEIVTLAFLADPVWSVALAGPDGTTDHHAAYWRFFVDGAHAQGGVWLTQDGGAVSIWVPPGRSELSEATLRELAAFNRTVLGDAGAERMGELYERFEANHLDAEPHAYLSLLATHPDFRGLGIGQALLAEDLARWDRLGLPSYLESTNPANDHRYERAGFRRVGGFTSVRDGEPISTMWRSVVGAA